MEIIDWGQTTEFDMIINATSLGLKYEDKIELNIEKKSGYPKFFYDLIYRKEGKKTNFISKGVDLGHITQDGSLMFIYQAMAAFELWGNKNDFNWNSQFMQKSLDFLNLKHQHYND